MTVQHMELAPKTSGLSYLTLLVSKSFGLEPDSVCRYTIHWQCSSIKLRQCLKTGVFPRLTVLGDQGVQIVASLGLHVLAEYPSSTRRHYSQRRHHHSTVNNKVAVISRTIPICTQTHMHANKSATYPGKGHRSSTTLLRGVHFWRYIKTRIEKTEYVDIALQQICVPTYRHLGTLGILYAYLCSVRRPIDQK